MRLQEDRIKLSWQVRCLHDEKTALQHSKAFLEEALQYEQCLRASVKQEKDALEQCVTGTRSELALLQLQKQGVQYELNTVKDEVNS
eukprot:12407371-Karenia_brevis.AAC.1